MLMQHHLFQSKGEIANAEIRQDQRHGMYIPEKRITNAELGAMIGYDVDKYLASKGIKVRYQAAPDESTSTMSVKAAQDALKSGYEAG